MIGGCFDDKRQCSQSGSKLTLLDPPPGLPHAAAEFVVHLRNKTLASWAYRVGADLSEVWLPFDLRRLGGGPSAPLSEVLRWGAFRLSKCNRRAP